jgi:hypothetical protein
MIPLLTRFCVFLLCFSLFPGCASFKKRSDAKHRAATERTVDQAGSQPLLVGKIALVNAGDRFVLIDAASTPATRVGANWRAYTGGAMSAELRATDVRRRPWVIADIVSGEPQTGDTVMQPAEAEAGTTPRAEPVRHETATPAAKPLPFWKRWLGRVGL